MSKKVPLEFVGDLIDNIHDCDCDCDKIFFTKDQPMMCDRNCKL